MKKLLTQLINKKIEEKGNVDLKKVYSKDYKPKRRIKPSDLGLDSLRRIFYSYMRVDPDTKFEPKILRIFNTGDALHEMMRGWVKDIGVLVEYKDPEIGEIPIDKWSGKPNPEFPINIEELEVRKGKIDAILIVDGKLWIGEFKSSKDSKYLNLDGPQDDHATQANTYVHLFEYCLQRGDYSHIEELKGHTQVSGVIYIYINKDTSDFKEYVCPKDDSDLEPIVAKIAKIQGYRERAKLPPCACEPKAWCPWNGKCSKNFNPCDEK